MYADKIPAENMISVGLQIKLDDDKEHERQVHNV